MEAELISTLFNYGFPSAIASYVIIRMEATMAKLTNAISELTILVKQNI